MTRRTIAGMFVALLAAMPAADLPASGQRGRGAGGPGTDPPSRYVIAGHVMDQAKRPVADAFVTAFLPSNTANRPSTPVSARLFTATDAHGNFRLEGLYPADFYVVVVPRNAPVDGSGRPTRNGYANTFYPSALTTASAKLVRVNTGVTAVAEITVRPARLSTVSGVVVGSNGKPIRGGVVNLAHGDRLFGFDTRVLEVSSTGTFSAPALQPGTYFLQYHESQWPPRRGETPTVSQAKVLVRDADVTGVRVTPIKLVIATGRVVVAPVDRDELLFRPVQIGATPVNIDGNPGPTRPGVVRDDLSFDLGAWPGPHVIRLEGLPPDWFVKAVRLRGATMPNQTVDFQAGKAIIGLEVEIARRRAPAAAQ
jgi:hypothetical protein